MMLLALVPCGQIVRGEFGVFHQGDLFATVGICYLKPEGWTKKIKADHSDFSDWLKDD